jgi:hypothetical protein
MAAAQEALGVKARGLVFTVLGDWLKEKHGEEGFAELIKGLSAEASELLSSARDGSKYPLQQLIAVLEAGARKSDSPHAYWAEFGSYLCKVSLATSFKGLIAYIDPVTLIKRMPSFWWRYFSAGDMQIEEVGRTKAVLSLGNPIGGEVISAMFTGWFDYALQKTDAAEVKVEAKGARWSISWQ